jgi:hypothetical protein
MSGLFLNGDCDCDRIAVCCEIALNIALNEPAFIDVSLENACPRERSIWFRIGTLGGLL